MPKTQPMDPASAYRALVAERHIKDDAAQSGVVQALQTLHEALAKKSLLRRKPPRGLYIWGNVGRGKSMLMDMFFAHAPVKQKRRAHFHAFMQEVHKRIHEIRKAGKGDPVALLAQEIAAETRLLCFDELQATDVADASILFRLFDGLFDAGVVVVATSNHPPVALYTGGHQRERFTKFIALIESRMDVCALTSPHDWRMQQVRGLRRTWFSPLGPEAEQFVEETLARLAPGALPQKHEIKVQGRTLALTVYADEIALASFAELCETALGPADYLAIAEAVETLILTGIPVLPPEKRNEAKRFVTLIDALYERKRTLIATAAAPPQELYPAGDGSFEFQRTVSRLIEMQGEKWLGG